MILLVAALIGGIFFGAGLVISGMTDTRIVLGFLDLFGTWDPTLLIVMAAALAATLPAFALAKNRAQSILGAEISRPTKKLIDVPLIFGAVLFGIGWGLIGLCPGPALANLASFSPQIFAFVGAMLAGMIAQDFWQKRGSPPG